MRNLPKIPVLPKYSIERIIKIDCTTDFIRQAVTLEQIARQDILLNVILRNTNKLTNVTLWGFQWKQVFGMCFEFTKDGMYTRVYLSDLDSIEVMRIPEKAKSKGGTSNGK